MKRGLISRHSWGYRLTKLQRVYETILHFRADRLPAKRPRANSARGPRAGTGSTTGLGARTTVT